MRPCLHPDLGLLASGNKCLLLSYSVYGKLLTAAITDWDNCLLVLQRILKAAKHMVRETILKHLHLPIYGSVYRNTHIYVHTYIHIHVHTCTHTFQLISSFMSFYLLQELTLGIKEILETQGLSLPQNINKA